MGLAGCASIESPPAAQSSAAQPYRLVLAELPVRRDDERLRDQFAAKSPADSPEARRAIDDAVAQAEAAARAEMQAAFGHQPGASVESGEATQRALAELQLERSDAAITAEAAQRLHAASGADYLLRFRVTDYGLTPRAWRNAYIAFEVISTLAIAAVAYSYPKTRAIAGIYLVEEGIEETVEGYAGFWALDEVSRPVRIEGELVSLSDARTAWKGSATGFSDVRLARIIRKVKAEEQQAQRARAMQHAARKLAADVADVVAREDQKP